MKHVLWLVETMYFIIVRINGEKPQQCVSFPLQNFFGFIQNSNLESLVSEKRKKKPKYQTEIGKTTTFTFKKRQEINIDGVVFRFSFWQDIWTSSILITIYMLSFSLEYFLNTSRKTHGVVWSGWLITKTLLLAISYWTIPVGGNS